VGAARVQEGVKRRRAEADRDLHRVGEGDTGEGLQGEYRRLLLVRGLGMLLECGVIFIFKAFEEEQPLADAVVTTGELLVAVVTKPKVTSLLLFCLGEALDGAAFNRESRLGALRRW